ncbi:hypothetical protein LWI28_004041 [Acer negundo]|uniref:E3 ubiquitin protein ligase DRIP2-like n=1 Tax=Acer negundo TaxID=4023 RepID=A0AAD5NZB7_ACENE|nr:hypothetical protein LWI28_004041 [Acer negundo]
MEDDLHSCPICNSDLGVAPLEKLRADNNLQDLRSRIFPSKQHNTSAPEAVPSVQLQPTRKERSQTPNVIALPRMIGRRSKPVKDMEAQQASLSSPRTFSELVQNKRRVKIPFTAKTSEQQTPDKDTEVEIVQYGKAGPWKPLNSPVEVARKSKSNKSNSQGIVAKPVVTAARDNETLPKSRVEEGGNASKVCGKENVAVPAPSGSMKPRRYQIRQRKTAASEGLSVPAQAIVNTNSECDERSGPIWFSLVASKDQPGDAPLPQIPSSYLRIKDSSLPVSFVKKYIVNKLSLVSETEVEILLWGEPLPSTMPLHTIASWYAQTTPSKERIQTTVGSSAREFLMVLRYGRKAPPPQTCFKNAYSHYFQQ